MRCNNHKCVKTPLWRGELTWSWLDLVTCWFMFDVKSRSWLILVQVPFLYLWLWEFFTPPPLTFISYTLHSIYMYSYDTFISRTGILWAKEPPSTLPTRIDSCPPVFFCGMDGSFEFHTQLSQWNLFTLRFDHFIEDQNFRVEILEKNPSPWDDSNTFWRRPRAKNPTFILVREKKSALLACLWLSSISKTHVAIVVFDDFLRFWEVSDLLIVHLQTL